jgi:UMF1 family MFS transporter
VGFLARRREVSGSRRSIFAWALYDFANSSFTTLVVTFVYATYFTQAVAPDEISGTALWSRAITVSALIVALASPVLGAAADRGGYRKRFLLAATTALYFIVPGRIAAALTLFVIANVSYELGQVFYNAFLPDITPADHIGRVSGFGWGLGYVGGLLSLAVALVAFVQPAEPWFGFTTEAGQNIRATNLMVALWFATFSVPLFLFVSEDRSAASPRGHVLRDTVRQLSETVRKLQRYREAGRFLLARLVYNDALVTVFAFGGIYAAGTFGFSMQEVLIFGLVLNVASGLGAFAMGFLDDALGGKRTITITLIGLIAATLMALFATERTWLWAAGILIGAFVGPNQSASRSLLGRFAPPEMENEFFGFFAFSGKLTAFLGPLLFGILTEIFASQRAGVAVVTVLLAVGLLLLTRVDEQAGIAARERTPLQP